MAKRFSFNLQKVLDLRAFEEHQAEIELGRAVSEKVRIESELKDNAQRRVASSLQKRSLDISDYAAVDLFLARLDAEKETLLSRLAQAELVIEQKRSVYLAAHQKKEVLAKLREKKELMYNEECTARETLDILNQPFNQPDNE